jgi:hypothetical protein
MKKMILSSIFSTLVCFSAHAFISSGNTAISVGSPPVGSPPVLPVAPTSPVLSPVSDTTLAISNTAVAVAQPAHLAGAVKYSLMDVRAEPASQVNLSSGSSVITTSCSGTANQIAICKRRLAALAATGKSKTVAELDAMKNGTDSCSSGGVFQPHGTTSSATYKNCLDNISATNLDTAAVGVTSSSTTLSTFSQANAAIKGN